MIEITVNIPALDRVADAIEKLVVAANGAGTIPPAAAAAPAASAEGKATRTTGAAKKDTAAAAAGSAKPASEEAQAGASTSTTAQTSASPSDDADGVPSADTVKSVAVKLSMAKDGREKLAKALADHGATGGVSTLPEANRAAFIAACEEGLAE